MLNLLKRRENGAPLTVAQHDANFTAIELAVNGLSGGLTFRNNYLDTEIYLSNGTNSPGAPPTEEITHADFAGKTTAWISFGPSINLLASTAVQYDVLEMFVDFVNSDASHYYTSISQVFTIITTGQLIPDKRYAGGGLTNIVYPVPIFNGKIYAQFNNYRPANGGGQWSGGTLAHYLYLAATS